jgi:endo-1,3-1,4-beta-glycanase ExoK
VKRALCGVFLIVVVAGCGSSPPPPQVSTFRAPEPARWKVTDHPLGRGELQRANVSFGRDGLTLALPQGTTNGGELQATGFKGDGRFAARLRAATSPGSISAFFLYRHDFATDSSDELDFEIPGVIPGVPKTVIVTVWQKGKKIPVAQKHVPLGFDPTAGFHDYEFKRDGTHVAFLVDGKQVFTSDKAPTSTLRPIFNAWYPTWQDPTVPPAGGRMVVSRYAFTPSA